MTARERYEQLETTILSPSAAKAADSQGRERAEEPCPFRTAFQRDRDRIIHSKAFRRLKHKTQVFLSPKGDHYRTRLTHTLEVSQIARSIARVLRLNEDLTEAIALGHDLGHTPFGHAGERALSALMPDGFRHYEQSVRVVRQLEDGGQGLNLTAEVIDGIYCHTNQTAKTREGQLVRFCDRIAYINHDFDDALRAGVLKDSDIPQPIRVVLGETGKIRLNTLIASLIHNSEQELAFSIEVRQAFDQWHAFMFDALYDNSIAKREEYKVDGLIGQMFAHFTADPARLPGEYRESAETEGAERAVCDFLAGMTDTYALELYRELFIPHRWE